MTMHLGAISFLSPLMLLGAAALALPILAHLLNRQARQHITFPTIQLLAEARADQSGLFRLRRLALLIIRCVAMLLIIMAFARPLWLDRASFASSSANGQQRRATIVVLDVSASIGQRQNGLRLIDVMRSEAQRLIGALEPGVDLANVIYAGAQPVAAYDQPIANLAALGNELNAIAPTSERAVLGAAIELAAAQLADQDMPTSSQRLIVMSDMQRENWPQATLAIEAIAQEGIDARIIPISAAASDTAPANTALSLPHCQPPYPIANTPVQLRVTVTNHHTESRTTTLRAFVDDELIDTQNVILAGRQQIQIAFDHLFKAIKAHRIRFEIDDDALSADNYAYAMAQTVARVNVGLISKADPQQPNNAAYFINRALAPHADARDTLEVIHLPASQITPNTFSSSSTSPNLQTLILVDAPVLSDSQASAIIDYVRAGGGLLFFSGAGAAVPNAATFNRLSTEPFLPLVPRGPRNHPSTAPLHLDRGAWSTPPMQTFDATSQQAFKRIAFYRTHAADLTPNTATALLDFSDGSPALATQTFGAGRVIAANFSPHPTSTDLPRHGLFVALLHSLVDHLRLSRNAPPTPFAGGALHFTPPPTTPATPTTTATPATPATSLTLTDPANHSIPYQFASTDSDQTDSIISAPRAKDLGFYTLSSAGQPLQTIAINIDPRESNLATITPAELETLAQNAATSSPRTFSTKDGRQQPLWPYLVIAAMLFYALELSILCVWRR